MIDYGSLKIGLLQLDDSIDCNNVLVQILMKVVDGEMGDANNMYFAFVFCYYRAFACTCKEYLYLL